MHALQSQPSYRTVIPVATVTPVAIRGTCRHVTWVASGKDCAGAPAWRLAKTHSQACSTASAYTGYPQHTWLAPSPGQGGGEWDKLGADTTRAMRGASLAIVH
jgi:hypothetical protein